MKSIAESIRTSLNESQYKKYDRHRFPYGRNYNENVTDEQLLEIISFMTDNPATLLGSRYRSKKMTILGAIFEEILRERSNWNFSNSKKKLMSLTHGSQAVFQQLEDIIQDCHFTWIDPEDVKSENELNKYNTKNSFWKTKRYYGEDRVMHYIVYTIEDEKRPVVAEELVKAMKELDDKYIIMM